MKNSNKFSTRTIAYAAIFIALSVAVNTMRIGSVSFGGFPIIFSGYALGPVLGFIVGGVADLVGFLVRPSATGGFNPLFSLTSALTGAIPVIVTRALGDRYPKYKLWKVFVGILVGQVITSVLLVPLFIALIAGKKELFYTWVVKAGTKQAVSIPIYAVLLNIIFEPLTKVIKFDEV